MPSPDDVANMIEAAGGKVTSMTIINEGDGQMHGAATASFPLRKDHWLYADDGQYEAPPMPMRMGIDDPRRDRYIAMVKSAARYAVRAATMKGKEDDFDPDALVQNMVTGMLGYYTPDGLCGSDTWANPNPIPPVFSDERTLPGPEQVKA